MKVLLKARHLAPIYGEQYTYCPRARGNIRLLQKCLTFCTQGIVHVVDVQSDRSTLVVNSGAWQSQTKYQQTMGITPTPGMAVIVNLATLQPVVYDFNQ